jgi:hypothetical protein
VPSLRVRLDLKLLAFDRCCEGEASPCLPAPQAVPQQSCWGGLARRAGLFPTLVASAPLATSNSGRHQLRCLAESQRLRRTVSTTHLTAMLASITNVFTAFRAPGEGGLPMASACGSCQFPRNSAASVSNEGSTSPARAWRRISRCSASVERPWCGRGPLQSSDQLVQEFNQGWLCNGVRAMRTNIQRSNSQQRKPSADNIGNSSSSRRNEVGSLK